MHQFSALSVSTTVLVFGAGVEQRFRAFRQGDDRALVLSSAESFESLPIPEALDGFFRTGCAVLSTALPLFSGPGNRYTNLLARSLLPVPTARAQRSNKMCGMVSRRR